MTDEGHGVTCPLLSSLCHYVNISASDYRTAILFVKNQQDASSPKHHASSVIKPIKQYHMSRPLYTTTPISTRRTRTILILTISEVKHRPCNHQCDNNQNSERKDAASYLSPLIMQSPWAIWIFVHIRLSLMGLDGSIRQGWQGGCCSGLVLFWRFVRGRWVCWDLN